MENGYLNHQTVLDKIILNDIVERIYLIYKSYIHHGASKNPQ